MEAGPFRITRKHYSREFGQGVHAHELGTIDFNLAGGGRGTYAGREVESRAGAVEFFAPGRAHSFQAGPSGIRTMHVSFLPDVLGERVACEGERPEAHVDQASAAGLATRLLGELCDPDCSSSLAAECLAYQLVEATICWIDKSEHGARWLTWARDQLHENHDLTLSQLAAQVGVHRAHLARSFSAQYGVSVGEYQRRLRLAKAAQRIASGDKSLTRVAHEFGFSDQAHLTRWFTRVLGVTPGVYARAMRAERVALRAWPRG
jgi:AraC family transcriptional regulator